MSDHVLSSGYRLGEILVVFSVVVTALGELLVVFSVVVTSLGELLAVFSVVVTALGATGRVLSSGNRIGSNWPCSQ